ncbi:hypothetical protein DRJ23_06725 [Candidatus Acetothermia bacterium]|nr:MAG: hypothetical protein DRJ23_06725 [Candidatus Acetothermia bacterium]
MDAPEAVRFSAGHRTLGQGSMVATSMKSRIPFRDMTFPAEITVKRERESPFRLYPAGGYQAPPLDHETHAL